MITTKRGASGKAKFSIDASTGFQNAASRLKLMNAKQYVDYMNEASNNDDEGDLYTPSVGDGPSNDWQSDIFRTAPVTNLHLGLSGGNDQLRYNVDGSFFKQTGIVIGSAYNRANGRVNVDYDATPKFGIKTSIALSRENTDRMEGDNSDNGIVTNAIGNPSIFPVRTDSGTYFGRNDRIDGTRLYLTNPVAIATLDRLPAVTDHIIGNAEANYHFTPKLTLTGRASTDVVHLHEDQWQSPLVIGTYASGAGGVAKSAFNNSNRYVLEGFATYQAGSDEGSSLNVVGGGSVEYNTGESNFLRGEGFSTPALQYVGSATSIVNYGGVPNAEHNLESFFARANYSWKNRYLALRQPSCGRRFAIRAEQPLGEVPGNLGRLAALGRVVHGQLQGEARRPEAARQLWRDRKQQHSELPISLDIYQQPVRRSARHSHRMPLAIRTSSGKTRRSGTVDSTGRRSMAESA